MARVPKPWWREYKSGGGSYFCKIGAERHNLGPELEEATRRCHELHAQRGKIAPAEKPDAVLWVMVDMFLTYQENRVSPARFRNYLYWLKPFVAAMGRTRLATSIQPDEVTDWMANYKRTVFYKNKKTKTFTWGHTSRSMGVSKIKACFRRAKKKGWISSNPLEDLDVPPSLERDTALTEEQYRQVLEMAKPDLRRLLQFLWETGARPSEVYILKFADLDLNLKLAKQPGKTFESTGKSREIHLSDAAIKLIPAAPQNVQATVFFKTNGHPWTKDDVGIRLRRIRDRLGFGREITASSFRRAFATDSALRHPEAVTAHLLGHRSTSSVRRYYIKLKNRPEAVRAALETIRPSEMAARQAKKSKPSRTASPPAPQSGKAAPKPRRRKRET